MPVILTVDAGAKVEDLVNLELQGFRVMTRPFVLGDLLAKVELPAKSAPRAPGCPRAGRDGLQVGSASPWESDGSSR